MVNINRANAIVTNRYIVRATQEGLSYVVDNRGRIENIHSVSDALIVQRVALISPLAFYCKYHDGIIFIYLFLCVGGLAWCLIRSQRKSV